MTLDVPPAWAGLAELLAGTAWRRLVVLGAADVGKSSFCRFLGRYLAQRGQAVGMLDTDLGQKMVGPPTCITLGQFAPDGELHLRHMRFVGEMSPAANIAGVVAASARLAGQAACDRLVVNTSGLITGPGVALKRWKLDALEPDHVIAIARAGELTPLLFALPPERVHHLLPSPAAQRKSPAARERNRRSALLAALAGCRPASLPGLAVEDLYRNAPEPDRFRLCGLAGPDGEDRAIGLLRWSDFVDRSELWTNVEPARVQRVRLGMTAPDLGELAESLPAGVQEERAADRLA